MGVPNEFHGLVGRDAELSAVERWLALLDTGPAGLVVHGEPGIGKTSVWSTAVGMAEHRGVRVLIARPVEAELALAYAALGDLLQRGVDEIIPTLSPLHSTALSGALALSTDPKPGSPLLVGRATLAALTNLAAEAPLLVAIDDVQWMDSPTGRALAFAARRVGDARIGFALTLRDRHEDPMQLATALGDRCVQIRLSGLSLGAMGHLLRERADAPMPRRRLVGIHQRSAGNPFFALELARAADVTDLADAVPSALVDLVRGRLDAAREGRAAIEVLAVLGPQPVDAVTDHVALDAAVSHGVLVEDAGQIRFAHPLLAAGAHALIPPGRRRELHRQAAAAAADALEVRARHLALATTSPDADVATIVEQAAASARARGAPDTAAVLLAHARRLTPPGDSADRDRRTMDQVECLMLADDQTAATGLVHQLLDGGVQGSVRVRALLVAALVALDPHEAVERLEAAVAEDHGDAILAARALTQLAWQRGAWLGDVEPAIDEALAAVAQAERAGDDATLVSALTTAGLMLSLSDRPGAAGQFERALAITDGVRIAVGDRQPRISYAAERFWRGDYETAATLLSEARQTAEAQGNEWVLARILTFDADLAMRTGRWDEAAGLLDEAIAGSVDYWRARALVLRAILRARRGDPRALEDVEEIRASPAATSDPLMAAAADFADGLVDHAAGRTADAADKVVRLTTGGALAGSRSAEFAIHIPEIVAILVEGGRLDAAETLGTSLARRTVQLAPWSDAAAALCLGLVATAAGRLDEAEQQLTTAEAGFRQLIAPWDLARTLLAQGSLFRRLGRRRHAAARLDEAIELFDALGAVPSVERARDELRRARPRQRRDDSLTAAETRVAALVAQGLTNREIAAQQFTTVATVEAHLTRVYGKLGIRSRTDLARGVTDGSILLETDR